MVATAVMVAVEAGKPHTASTAESSMVADVQLLSEGLVQRGAMLLQLLLPNSVWRQ